MISIWTHSEKQDVNPSVWSVGSCVARQKIVVIPRLPPGNNALPERFDDPSGDDFIDGSAQDSTSSEGWRT